MKNILHITLVITFVVSCAALTSAQIRPTVSAPRIFTLPSGKILILPTRPLPQFPKTASVFNTLPAPATTLRFPQTSPFPSQTLPILSKPTPVFGNSLPLPKPQIIKLSSGKIFIIPARPLPQLPKPASTLNSLPLWTKPVLIPKTAPLFPSQTLPVIPKPTSIFGNPLPTKINTIKDPRKTLNEQRMIETLEILRDGLLKINLKNQKKNLNYLTDPSQPKLLPDSSLDKFTLDVPQDTPAREIFSPTVVVTSNFDKPMAHQVQSSTSAQLTNSRSMTNSSLKVVHVTADGTAILMDDQNNYYSLPLNNVRNNKENVSNDVTKQVKQQQNKGRNRVRSRN